MTLQTKLTVRLSNKDKRSIKHAVKQSKERTMSDYIRAAVLKDIRNKNESRTEQLKANQK
jgi:Arc/MetJ-type ribon-helix-helix transcriptional regulator